MYKIVPVSFIFDFASEEVQEEMKKFITFFIEYTYKGQPNPEKQDNEDKKNKSTYRKRDLLCEVALDSPKKALPKQSKNSPVKLGKKISEANEGSKKK